jgi:hypothetical protein
VHDEDDGEGDEAEERRAAVAVEGEYGEEREERPDRRVLIEEDVVVVANVVAVRGGPLVDVAEERELMGEGAALDGERRDGGDEDGHAEREEQLRAAEPLARAVDDRPRGDAGDADDRDDLKVEREEKEEERHDAELQRARAREIPVGDHAIEQNRPAEEAERLDRVEAREL